VAELDLCLVTPLFASLEQELVSNEGPDQSGREIQTFPFPSCSSSSQSPLPDETLFSPSLSKGPPIWIALLRPEEGIGDKALTPRSSVEK